MTLPHDVLLFSAAILAGVMNSVAGGGSFISFPALVFTGVPPIPANATSTVALWPGIVASAGAYRHRLPRGSRLWIPMVAASVTGGVAGALLLLHTRQSTFMHMVPYLFLAATLLFAFGKRISARFGSTAQTAPSLGALAAATAVQFAIAVYGGFFGGGIGILILAILTLLGMKEIHSMNAIKTVLAASINGVAIITFIVAKAVFWPEAILMVAGSILGGYGGAKYAQRVNPRLVRGFVIFVGLAMSAYFMARY